MQKSPLFTGSFSLFVLKLSVLLSVWRCLYRAV